MLRKYYQLVQTINGSLCIHTFCIKLLGVQFELSVTIHDFALSATHTLQPAAAENGMVAATPASTESWLPSISMGMMCWLVGAI